MTSVLKIALACALGFGALLMESQAAPSLAFLGLTRDSDPLIREALAKAIRFELAGDSGLSTPTPDRIQSAFITGALEDVEPAPWELPRLSREIGAQFYAFGKLEPMSHVSARKWFMPWQVKTRWSRDLRLRVVEASTGRIMYDGVVPAEYTERSLFFSPESSEQRMAPGERDLRSRRSLALLSVASAKTLAKVLREAPKKKG